MTAKATNRLKVGKECGESSPGSRLILPETQVTSVGNDLLYDDCAADHMNPKELYVLIPSALESDVKPQINK